MFFEKREGWQFGFIPGRLDTLQVETRELSLNGEISERVECAHNELKCYDIYKSNLGVAVNLIFRHLAGAQKFINTYIKPILGYSPNPQMVILLQLTTYSACASEPSITETEMYFILETCMQIKAPSNPQLQLDRTQLGMNDVVYAGKTNWRQSQVCRKQVAIHHGEYQLDDESNETIYAFVAEGFSPIKAIKISKQPNGEHCVWLHFSTSDNCIVFGKAWNKSKTANSIVQKVPNKYSIIKDDKIFPEYFYEKEDSVLNRVQTAIPCKFKSESVEQNAIVVMLKWAATAYEWPEKLIEDICSVVAKSTPSPEEYQTLNWREIDDRSQQFLSPKNGF